MKKAEQLRPIIRIATYAFLDEVRQKSFLAMFVLCMVFAFLVRGCYQGNYMVNGQVLDAGTVAGAVSKAAFHGIAVVTMLITALFSTRLFRRDREAGMQSSILSKPITRRQYVLGKVFGMWAWSALFMLVLQTIVFFTATVTSGVVMPGYLIASLFCCLNLFFVVLMVLLLSLLMPEAVAFLGTLGVAVVSLIVEGVYALGNHMVHTTAGLERVPELSAGKLLFYGWPKLSAMQYFASSFIDGGYPSGFLSVYPLINIVVYSLVLGALLLFRFKKEEIA